MFDTVNIHKLIHKLTLTNTPNTIIKFIANYIKGRQACTQYNRTVSKLKQINTKVTKGGVLFPTLFNIYAFDIPLAPKDGKITTYADESLHLTPNTLTLIITPDTFLQAFHLVCTLFFTSLSQLPLFCNIDSKILKFIYSWHFCIFHLHCFVVIFSIYAQIFSF